MNIEGAAIIDTFAEAFPMVAARVVITAVNRRWARIAAEGMTGYAASVIGCDAEAGIERELDPSETPDGRPGVGACVLVRSRKSRKSGVEPGCAMRDDLRDNGVLQRLAGH